jgi:histidinol-phosphate aminotransferase
MPGKILYSLGVAHLTGPFQFPPARPDVTRDDLTRPDWVNGFERPPAPLWLDKNENLDPVLGEWNRKLLVEIDPRSISTYPECAPLYRKLAGFVGLAPENLLLTPGSDGGIRAVFAAFVSVGDPVLFTSPTFAMYSVYSKMFGAKAIPVEYERFESGPRLPLERLLEAISTHRPKVVCLPNPDSPTGTVFDESAMRKIIEASGEVGALMLVDEAYHPFYESTVISWIREYPHLVVARTFAKAWGLAGLRIGYLAADERVAKLLHKVRSMYEVNTLSVDVIGRALDHPEQMLASVKRLNDGKKFFLDQMAARKLSVLRGHGNFLHVAFGDRSEDVFRKLNGVALFRKDFSEPCLKGLSRFSSTTRELFGPVVTQIFEGLDHG